ncbi:MAG: hypothetical protein Q7T23_13230 [Phenylobacterium sp.]|nr:hypothetical protein [Phenylobacterium sp.]
MIFDDHIVPEQAAAVRRLVELEDAGEILLVMPASVKGELDHPNTSAAAKAAAIDHIYTIRIDPIPVAQVELALRGNGEPGRHLKDATHIADALSGGGGYFVTLDGRIRTRLANFNDQLWIVTPVELLAAYDRHLSEET